jgi:hypothetical protein
MKHFRHLCAAAAIVLVVQSVLAGCSAPAREEAPAPATPPYRFVASIREVMNSVIDPSVDEVWNSVGSTVDERGLTDRAPSTEEHWAEVRRHALVVSEAANLLLMPNRPVAPPGAPSLAPGVELTPEEIRPLIDNNLDAWNTYVLAFQDSLKPALAAIEKKDSEALFEAGEGIDATCESCHSVFWYPKAGASKK